jgi:transcriptional regulator with XRE-family HTH domain
MTVLRGVNEAIENAGVSRAELAEVLGTSRPYVSQVLNGSTNATLKTLGALLWASGTQIAGLQIEPLGSKRGRDNTVGFQLKVTTTSAENINGTITEVRKAG